MKKSFILALFVLCMCNATTLGMAQDQLEMLHIDGAIRGGGTNGEVTLTGNNGSITIGAPDAQTMVFDTDRSKYSFNSNGVNCMTIHSNGNVGIGTISSSYKLDVAGTIRANEIIVNTFIKENKHLPEIKSAQEMQENGVGINELQTQLLQKIEELTLYILQQEEIINQQGLRIDALEKNKYK